MIIFDLIGCDRSDNFQKVKRAYLKKTLQIHPDKNPGQEAQATKEFVELNLAWAEYLEHIERLKTNRVSKTQAPTSSGQPVDPTGYTARDGSTDIFIPVEFTEILGANHQKYNPEETNKWIQKFNFFKISFVAK